MVWKDLVDRTEILKRNPVVRHLIDTPKEAYGYASDLPDERCLDLEVAAHELLMPLLADSSQTAAVVAASRGKDFVLFGPPGTGKSQTIANLVVQVLGEGKRVLFVSQKTTALAVVRQRLDKIGLGSFCLEVHSAKAQKSTVLTQLKNSWESRAETNAEEWEAKTAELGSVREQLNALVSALHRRRRNGLNAYEAFGRVVAARDWKPELRLTFPSADHHGEADLQRLRNLCHSLKTILEAMGNPAHHPLRLIGRKEWSPAWQRDLVSTVGFFTEATRDLALKVSDTGKWLGAEPSGDPRRIRDLLLLAAQALKPEGRDGAALLSRDLYALRETVAAWSAARSELLDATRRISCRYRDGVFALDLPRVFEEWREAAASNFLVRNSRKKRVWHALDPFTDDPIPADLGAEIACLIDVAAARQRAGQFDAALAMVGSRWKGLASDPDEIEQVLAWSERTRALTKACATPARDAQEWQDAVVCLIRDCHADLAEGGAARQSIVEVFAAFRAFEEQRKAIVSLAQPSDEWLGISIDDAWLSRAVAAVATWPGAITQSQRWCAWQEAASAAAAEGLHPLMSAIVSGELRPADILPAFEIAHARWWADEIVDTDRALRTFRAEDHEDAIARFSRLDDEVPVLPKEAFDLRVYPPFLIQQVLN